tara:strand:+ start:1612 stop:1776 length:165 start_codon:yes stop_codon:yes gene_type:complete
LILGGATLAGMDAPFPTLGAAALLFGPVYGAGIALVGSVPPKALPPPPLGGASD